MRFVSKLTMTVAAIFFAVSVSAGGSVTTGDREGGGSFNADLCAKTQQPGKKAYQVCKSWRDDQGGPMPTNMMQHCWNTLCDESYQEGFNCKSVVTAGSHCVNDKARSDAKELLGYW